MKKSISLLVLLALVAGGAFAAGFGLSVGGGLIVDYSGGNGYKVSYDGPAYFASRYGETETVKYNNTSFGFYGFFDATYVEIDIGYARGSIKPKYQGFSGLSIGANQLFISLLGKYPIELAKGKFVIFPLLGVSYNRVISASVIGFTMDEPGKLSQFGIQGGVGLDFNLTKKLFLRAETLIQVRLPNSYMNDEKDDAEKTVKDYNDSYAAGVYGKASVDFKKKLGIGPVIKVAVGYKF